MEHFDTENLVQLIILLHTRSFGKTKQQNQNPTNQKKPTKPQNAENKENKPT